MGVFEQSVNGFMISCKFKPYQAISIFAVLPELIEAHPGSWQLHSNKLGTRADCRERRRGQQDIGSWGGRQGGEWQGHDTEGNLKLQSSAKGRRGVAPLKTPGAARIDTTSKIKGGSSW